MHVLVPAPEPGTVLGHWSEHELEMNSGRGLSVPCLSRSVDVIKFYNEPPQYITLTRAEEIRDRKSRNAFGLFPAKNVKTRLIRGESDIQYNDHKKKRAATASRWDKPSAATIHRPFLFFSEEVKSRTLPLPTNDTIWTAITKLSP